MSEAPATPPEPSLPFGMLQNPGLLQNPYGLYAMLRAASPVLRPPIPGYEGPGAAILTRFADCEQALKQDTFSVDRRRADLVRHFAALIPAELLDGPGAFRSMLTMDPPDHTRLRGLVSRAFTPRMVERLRPRVEALVGELLDDAQARGGMDVIHDFAEPLPAIVIAELLGVPAEDHRDFKKMSSAILQRSGARLNVSDDEAKALRQNFQVLMDYMREQVEARRRRPGEDLISAMLAAQEERDALSEQELVSTSLLLLIAGHETTTNLIGNGLLALLRSREEWERLCAEPGLVENAVEELLRYDSPVQATIRVATEDVAFQDEAVPAGAVVVCLLGAANRDPAAFEAPDRLDLGRENVHHLSLGWGPHYCLGAGLARLEGRAAFAGLARRFPAMQLAGDEPRYRPNPFLRGLEALPVSL